MGQSKVVTVVLSEYAFALDIEIQNEFIFGSLHHPLQSGTSGVTDESTDCKGMLIFFNILK